MAAKLTEKEKLVLWGLTEYPDSNDIELSKKLGIERRTFSAVKTKLRNRGAFYKVIVPDFAAIGCEILTLHYGTFNPSVTFEDRKEGVKKILECEEIIHTFTTSREHINMSISKNFTELNKKASVILRFYKEKNFLDSVSTVYFPLEISSLRFFEFSGLIKTIFGLDVECEDKNESPPMAAGLTKKEKKVLYALVKMPEANIVEIADATGITMHTVARIKKRMIKDGIIRVKVIPNFVVLGCELLALMHVKYKLDKTPAAGYHEREIFWAKSGAESLSLSLFEDYTHFRDYHDKKREYLKENDMVSEEPTVLLFPVKNLNSVKNFSFAPLVKKLLNVDADF